MVKNDFKEWSFFSGLYQKALTYHLIQSHRARIYKLPRVTFVDLEFISLTVSRLQ